MYLSNYVLTVNKLYRYTVYVYQKKGVRRTMSILKVSAKSSPNSIAGALTQAIKAIAIARGFVAPLGIELVCIPAFTEVDIDGQEKTAIRLIVEPRK